MLSFLAKRIAQLIPTLFFVSILIFSLQHLLPGDPPLVMAGEERDPAVIEQIRQQYRLAPPIPRHNFFLAKGSLSAAFALCHLLKASLRASPRASCRRSCLAM